MVKIEIATGFIIACVSGFGLLDSTIANVFLGVIGAGLFFHGSYEVFYKVHVHLDRRLAKWLLNRNWQVQVDKQEGFYFVLRVEDESHREVSIVRSRKNKGVLVFTAPIIMDKGSVYYLGQLETIQRKQLIEDIRVFFATKNMGFDSVEWPLDKLAAQHALQLDPQLSEHSVDLKAKEVIHAVVGVRSLIRKTLYPLESGKEGSQL